MITFPVSLAANWQPASAFPDLTQQQQGWLLEAGSLTAKLKSHCQAFSVEVLNEAPFDLTCEQQALLYTSLKEIKDADALKERIKNIVGPLLAMVGIERYYQLFMPENDFQQMVIQAGMQVEEAKSFNTTLKGIHKVVPAQHQDEHLQRWLDYELWLNEIGTPYNDDLAKLWVTRNFVIRKK